MRCAYPPYLSLTILVLFNNEFFWYIDKTHAISHHLTFIREMNMDWQNCRLSTRLQLSGELVTCYDWAMVEKFKHPLILIANFIFEYLAIHPFQDGNGRTSRRLTNLMLLQNGYSFASLVSHERLVEQSKADYHLALNKSLKYHPLSAAGFQSGCVSKTIKESFIVSHFFRFRE